MNNYIELKKQFFTQLSRIIDFTNKKFLSFIKELGAQSEIS